MRARVHFDVRQKMKTESKQVNSSGLGYCLLAGVSIIAVTVVAVRYQLKFTQQISEDGMIRGMMSALVVCPLIALALNLTLRSSRAAFVAALLVPSFFSALWIHEVLFGNKMPELAYQEPLLPRIVAVLVYLTSVVALPAMLAMIPFVFRLPSSSKDRNEKAEQGAADRPLSAALLREPGGGSES